MMAAAQRLEPIYNELRELVKDSYYVMADETPHPVPVSYTHLIGVLRTDGKENLMTSIEIAIAQNKEGRALVPEVCIFFENQP